MNRMYLNQEPDMVAHPDTQSRQFQVRFVSLFNEGRAMAFPSDREGRVNLDSLPERARQNYLFARSMVGRDFAAPSVRAV